MLRMFPALVVSAALLGTQSIAGGTDQPPAEPAVMVEPVEDPGSMGSMGSGGWIVPLLLIGVIAYAVSQDDEPVGGPSDSRIKTDVHRIGTAENGLPIYTFKYLWSDMTYQGVMAQDVEVFMPDAVITGLFGVKLVNYEMLGMELKTLG